MTGAAASASIRLQHLTVDYASRGSAMRAVDDVSLEIAAGEFVALLGPSGCGKSTILRSLAGLLPASAGTIEIADTPVRRPRRDVGVVFQDATLLPWLTAIENIRLPGRVMKLDPRACETRARALLALVGLEGFADHYPAQLSGGMHQRVGIARGLLHDPSVLLMDEPFGALDAMTREQMNLELQRIWSADRKTVLFVTHSVPEAVFLADRIVVLSPRPGRIAEIVVNRMGRPRRMGDTATPEFAAIAERLRLLFDQRGRID
jgi:NitT/TauT family transport system ATP-binding protein